MCSQGPSLPPQGPLLHLLSPQGPEVALGTSCFQGPPGFLWGYPSPSPRAGTSWHSLAAHACRSLVPALYGRQFRGAWHPAKPGCRDQSGLEIELENGEGRGLQLSFGGGSKLEGSAAQEGTESRCRLRTEHGSGPRRPLPCSFSPLLSTVSAGEHPVSPGHRDGAHVPQEGLWLPSPAWGSPPPLTRPPSREKAAGDAWHSPCLSHFPDSPSSQPSVPLQDEEGGRLPDHLRCGRAGPGQLHVRRQHGAGPRPGQGLPHRAR